MTKVIKISLLFIMFILVFLFTSCTEQKQREYDIIDGNIYIDLFENKDEFIKNGLKAITKHNHDSSVLLGGVNVYIYVDYNKMDDYMKAIHKYNLKYSYSSEEDKIKNNYYYYLNSYIYESFDYDFHDDYDFNDDSTDPNEHTFYNKCYKNKAIVYLHYWTHSHEDPTMSSTGLDKFYLDYDKIKEIASYDYVTKIEVIEECELVFYEGTVVYTKK